MSYAQVLAPTKRGHWMGVNGPFPMAANRDTELSFYRALGVNLVRVDMAASFLARPEGVAKAVEYVKACVNRGLAPICLIGYSLGGEYAQIPTDIHSAPTAAGVAKYREVVYHSAGPLIAAGARIVEGSNEWNGTWGMNPIDVAALASMQVALNDGWKAAAHEQRTSCTVLTGGTAMAPYAAPTAIVDYLRSQAGAPLSFDAIALHPGTHPQNPHTTGRNEGWNPFFQCERTRDILFYIKRRNVQVWATEIPWPSAGPTALKGGEAEQVSRCRQDLGLFFKWQSEGWFGPAVMYHGMRDGEGDTGNDYGIRRRDGSEKPVCAALRELAAQPFTRPPVVP